MVIETSLCAIHEVAEPVTEDGTVCFECQHSYADDAAILTEWNESFPENRLDHGQDTPFCPICIHDW